jgi:hypothetical protein
VGTDSARETHEKTRKKKCEEKGVSDPWLFRFNRHKSTVKLTLIGLEFGTRNSAHNRRIPGFLSQKDFLRLF